jgi:hypothetical protein
MGMMTTTKGYTMGKHRLEGKWYSPAASTVFVCQNGEVVCSKRGLIGRASFEYHDLQIGTAWDSVHENKY